MGFPKITETFLGKQQVFSTRNTRRKGAVLRLLVVAHTVKVSANKDVLHKTYCHIFGCYAHIPNTEFDNTVQNISEIF